MIKCNIDKSKHTDDEWDILCMNCGKAVLYVHEATVKKAAARAKLLLEVMNKKTCEFCGAKIQEETNNAKTV